MITAVMFNSVSLQESKRQHQSIIIAHKIIHATILKNFIFITRVFKMAHLHIVFAPAVDIVLVVAEVVKVVLASVVVPHFVAPHPNN